VRVKLDPSWHLKADLHPDPRAAHAIAMAVAARLKADLGADLAREDSKHPFGAPRLHDDGSAD
jgi:hypothetical protein